MTKDKTTVGDFEFTGLMFEHIAEIAKTGRLTYGPKSKELERRFAAIHGCNYGVVSNSGTSSLQVAIQALKELSGWKSGDEILIPSITFVATANAVLNNNMVPVPIDVDPYTYNLNPDNVVFGLSNSTVAILPVHAFGLPANMYAINQIASDLNLAVIEDSCEAAFTGMNGQMVGSMSDVGVFSFYVAHLLTAGVGGMATTNNKELANYMRSLTNHGWDRKERPVDLKSSDFSIDEVRSRYYFPRRGHSFRLTELEAAIALSQLDDYKEMISTRVKNASLIVELIRGSAGDLMQYPIVRNNSFMMLPLMYMGDGDKWALIEHLEKAGIETREMLPLINQPCYGSLFAPDDYPVANWIEQRGFYIGSHQFLDDVDFARIEGAFYDFFS